MLVKEVMTPKVEWVDPEVSVKESAFKMRELNIGCLPVEEKGKIIGMVTDRDIACRAVAEGRDPRTMKVRDLMSTEVVTCREDADINEATHLMEEKGLARLPVFDRNDHLVGMLSIKDVSTHCSHETSGSLLEAVAKHHH
jgi:CBS domain-containing protein